MGRKWNNHREGRGRKIHTVPLRVAWEKWNELCEDFFWEDLPQSSTQRADLSIHPCYPKPQHLSVFALTVQGWWRLWSASVTLAYFFRHVRIRAKLSTYAAFLLLIQTGRRCYRYTGRCIPGDTRGSMKKICEQEVGRENKTNPSLWWANLAFCCLKPCPFWYAEGKNVKESSLTYITLGCIRWEKSHSPSMRRIKSLFFIGQMTCNSQALPLTDDHRIQIDTALTPVFKRAVASFRLLLWKEIWVCADGSCVHQSVSYRQPRGRVGGVTL